MAVIVFILPLVMGWIADRLFGDPPSIPHPVVGFGKLIAAGERLLNKGKHRLTKGAIMSVLLILSVFVVAWLVNDLLLQVHSVLYVLFDALIIFYCLAGTTLVSEVRQVFAATDRSLAEGRTQVARIVGRDTSQLDAQQIRKAALETLAENLSDGVIAPLFWYMLLGVPGMLAYKMVNTLDSMIGYKNDRYRLFGCWAARIDDVANYIPARLTALLMAIVSKKKTVLAFIRKYGHCHASPNSGYPESALAGILDCRFGGPNSYFGQVVEKPYIGSRERPLTSNDMEVAVRVNKYAEAAMIVIGIVVRLAVFFIFSGNLYL